MTCIRTDVKLRDPFVLLAGGKYYMYGSRVDTVWGYADGFDVYVSEDLVHWSEPVPVFHNDGTFWADQNYWAPEVHHYNGAYYMFASFKKEGRARGTQILRAELPSGPFLPISAGPVTPEGWDCLDGTLYVDGAGRPYIVFCHEWKQVGNGTICAMELSSDLTRAVAPPVVLFDAKSAGWTIEYDGPGRYVTDGPFLWRMGDGSLVMLWSSHGGQGYAQAMAKSDSGELCGPWRHNPDLLFAEDGGHGMVFATREGRWMLGIHRPNETPQERVMFIEVEEKDGWFALLEPCEAGPA